MSADRLDEATEALRAHLDEDPAPVDRVRQTRQAILDSVSAAPERNLLELPTRFTRPSRSWVFAIAASFVLLASFALAGGRITHWMGLSGGADLHDRDAPSPSVPSLSSALPSSPVAPAPQPGPSTSEALPPPEVPVAQPAASTTVRTASTAAADELYYRAHALHFDDRNYPAAVTAWERYMQSAPNGRFAPEARYNRAMALLRLGRKVEAETALRPFAEGAYGNYRKAEAAALLKQMSEP
jgi:tetratricopeptide (TPR) repeat protein